VDTSEKFHITPFVGTDLVAFGMSAPEVERALGPPDRTSEHRLGSRVEFRSAMNIGYSQATGQVDHIGFGRQMTAVYFRELNLFSTPPDGVLRELMACDPQPLTSLGFVVFRNLGIALTGFHDGDESQKAATLFAQGAWDRRATKMKPYVSATKPVPQG
jgi:hypothetical protein